MLRICMRCAVKELNQSLKMRFLLNWRLLPHRFRFGASHLWSADPDTVKLPTSNSIRSRGSAGEKRNEASVAPAVILMITKRHPNWIKNDGTPKNLCEWLLSSHLVLVMPLRLDNPKGLVMWRGSVAEDPNYEADQMLMNLLYPVNGSSNRS